MKSQDTETEKEVSRSDLVKGFEFEKDCYVLLDVSKVPAA
jgi:non-homologous end joining protein Ku